MAIEHISAVTLAVRDMARSVEFYEKFGLGLSYGGKEATFSTFRVGTGFINLILEPSQEVAWWGRAILRVNGVDSLYRDMKNKGLDPDELKYGPWGERYFHIRDPDGHELSFAELLK